MSEELERLKTALADRYRVERELGRGGMATVYLAEDLKHHRKVAVKVLRPELAAILGAERFLKEIEVTAHLQHPHILPLFDSGEADSFLYYVMPHVEGESLRDKLNREKQLGVAETVEIAKGVAAALDYAHRQGVIHRDIKPENILIHDGQPVVADFGIALAVTTAGGPRLTETGLSLGTPEYMSPEQATGERELTGQTDVYSLGAVVYEMLAGEPPHTGATVQAIVARVVSAEPEPIAAVRPSVPPNADAAVHQALAKVPGDRFASPGALAAALADPSYAPHDWVAPASSRGATMWKRRAAVIAVLGVLASVLTFFAARPNDRSRNTPRPVARLAFDAPGITARSGGGRIAVSADGSTIVYVAEDSSGTRLFMRRLDSPEPTLMPGTEQARRPFFSPDGEWIGFDQASELKKMRLDGGPALVIARVEPSYGASWSAQDVIIFGALGGLYTVSAGGGEPQLALEQIPKTRFGRPAALPDGNSVLFTQFDVTLGATLAVWSLLDGTVTDLEQRGMSPRYVNDGIVVFSSYDGQLVARQYDQRRKRLVGIAVPVAQGVDRAWGGMIGTAHFGVSATGTVAYLDESGGLSELVMVDRQGSIEVLPAPPRRYEHPRFSPDGRHIVAEIALPDRPNSGDIWSYDVRVGTLTRLTFDSTSIYPEWTPDGQRVTYAGARDGDWDLYWVPANGGDPERLLARDGDQWQALVTPDRRTVAFYEYIGDETRQDIFVASLDDPTAVRPLARSGAREIGAAMSPDGHWLAYKSDATGRFEVYVQPVTEAGAAIPVSPGGGQEPRWGPNGRELFYRDGESTYVVPFEPGNPPSLGRARLLFTNDFARSSFQANYDVHPDGQRFVFVRERRGTVGTIQVVLNWFDHWPGSR